MCAYTGRYANQPDNLIRVVSLGIFEEPEDRLQVCFKDVKGVVAQPA